MPLAALVDPAAHRIYGDATHQVAIAEWTALSNATARVENLGGNDFLITDADDEVAQRLIALLSTTVAAFDYHDSVDGPTLGVLDDQRPDWLPSSIVTIQRYRGKTNERFTQMLLSLAVSHLGDAATRPDLSVFDPLAGRGTTLNAAVRRGYNAGGIEIDTRDHREYVNFIANWMKDNRLKHKLKKAHVRDAANARKETATLTYARTKDAYTSGDTRQIQVVNGDTLQARSWFPKASFEALVTDLPYGVQHGAEASASGWSTPIELLDAGLPVWLKVMKRDAAVVLSWNLRTLGRNEVVAALEHNGLTVHDDYGSFEHRVDHSIHRDLVIATRH